MYSGEGASKVFDGAVHALKILGISPLYTADGEKNFKAYCYTTERIYFDKIFDIDGDIHFVDLGKI